MPYFVNRSGDKLWFEDTGTGVAVVFIHGWCMSSAVWHYQLIGLKNSFRVIAPDLRGHGASRSITGRLNFETFAADLSDLFCFLDLTGIILVGWSMGAQVALQAYSEVSDRLAGLVLLSSTPCFTAKADFPHGLARNEAAGMRIKVGRDAHRALEGFHARMFEESELENLEIADQIRALLVSIVPPDTNATLAALDSLANADMRNLLPDINIPTLVVNGERDKICLPEASNYLVSSISTASQIVFPRSGHAPFLSRYGEFNADIARFAESVCAKNA